MQETRDMSGMRSGQNGMTGDEGRRLYAPGQFSLVTRVAPVSPRD